MKEDHPLSATARLILEPPAAVLGQN